MQGMARKRLPPANPAVLLKKIPQGKTILQCEAKKVLFSQGDPADAVFYIERGRVKLTVFSRHGKEAVLAILEEGSFFGEGCLIGQPLRMATATAIQQSTIARFEKKTMVRLLHENPRFSESFTRYLLSRTVRVEEDLVDQLFNSTEKRLARVLLLLARFGKEGQPEPVVARVSQETLAAMVGASRARVSSFMNKFRKLGFIEYNGGFHVHSSLLNVFLHE